MMTNETSVGRVMSQSRTTIVSVDETQTFHTILCLWMIHKHCDLYTNVDVDGVCLLN